MAHVFKTGIMTGMLMWMMPLVRNGEKQLAMHGMQTQDSVLIIGS